ncbi:hypothetical protein FHS18_000705 [Paenibacillus phyllosphaerae]|uniref:Uncharacterized protein n=1 Tax=Paenibacillus phyllosphaerae TaxID=274593 RepID=A0A7W5AU52_9BACL|nr:hypothetical protein [Paenibacillus phyllosphaerae]MBB3108677.1 hypothetical protein [Paenibacillus phyllosphaerae]
MAKSIQIEKALWSIALPGFGQLLNGKYIKGIVLIASEVLINVKAHLNEIIMLSFLGRIDEAVSTTNFQWLLFYPCFYMFGIWDAYRDAGNVNRFGFLPPVTAAYCATVGVFYANCHLFGVKWGPVWLPMISCFVGLGLGRLLMELLNRSIRSAEE